jgi:hypothetical protein
MMSTACGGGGGSQNSPVTVSTPPASGGGSTGGGGSTAPVSITVTPSTPTVVMGATQQFSAVASNGATVSWSASYGTITNSGLYTAPANGFPFDTVTAFTGTVSKAVSVTLVLPTLTVTNASSFAASADETISMSLSGVYGSISVAFSRAGGVLMPPEYDPGQIDPYVKRIRVPYGSVSGNIVLTRTAYGFPDATVSIPFTRLPNLRIRAGHKDLSAGESIQIQSRFLGSATTMPITWSSTAGTVDANGSFTAPLVTSETFVRARGCINNGRSCDEILFRVAPIVIRPTEGVVAANSNLGLQAVQNGSVITPQWSLPAGGGTIDANGIFNPSGTVAEAGLLPVSAMNSGQSGNDNLVVAEKFSGAVAHVYDYADQSNHGFEGSNAIYTVVAGNRLYVSNFGERYATVNGAFAAPPSDAAFKSIDIYDVTNPAKPVWIDAVESGLRYAYDAFASGNKFYEIQTGYGVPNALATYQIQNGTLALLGIQPLPAFVKTGRVGTKLYGVKSADVVQNKVTVTEIDVATMGVRELSITSQSFGVSSLIGDGSRLYVAFVANLSLSTYDISGANPALLSTIQPDNGVFQMYLQGHLLFSRGKIFDVTGTQPMQVGNVDIENVEGVVGSTAYGRTYIKRIQYSVADISDPGNPLTKATFADYGSFGTSSSDGRYAYVADGESGVLVYDTLVPSGPKETIRQNAFYQGPVTDQDSTATTFIVSGRDYFGSGGIVIFDISQPGQLLPTSILTKPAEMGYAVRIYGNYAYVAMQNTLWVVDFTDIAHPVLITTLNISGTRLDIVGSRLYVASDANLLTLDLTNPALPVQVSSQPLSGIVSGFAHSGTRLFVASAGHGVSIYDASTAPATLLGTLPLSEALFDMTVAGDTIYLAALDDGVLIADATDATAPRLLTKFSLPHIRSQYFPGAPPVSNTAIAVTYSGNTLYVGGYLSSVIGYDVSSPAHPRVISSEFYGAALATYVTSMAMKGPDLFIAGDIGVGSSLVRADYSSPRNTILLREFPPALQWQLP